MFAWLAVLLYVIAALHIAALYFFWYWSIWWYDILVHILGGVWIGGMALFFISRTHMKTPHSLFVRFVFPFLIVAVFGTLWEAFEWNVDQIILFRFQNDIVDTLSDIGADIGGGLIASFLWFRQGLGAKVDKDMNNTHD